MANGYRLSSVNFGRAFTTKGTKVREGEPKRGRMVLFVGTYTKILPILAVLEVD